MPSTPTSATKRAATTAATMRRAAAIAVSAPAGKSAKQVAAVAKAETRTAPRKRAAGRAVAATPISAHERHHLIAVAAYYMAERHGFSIGTSQADWLAAELQIDQMIAAGKFDS